MTSRSSPSHHFTFDHSPAVVECKPKDKMGRNWPQVVESVEAAVRSAGEARWVVQQSRWDQAFVWVLVGVSG